jgi:hypothetical protein
VLLFVVIFTNTNKHFQLFCRKYLGIDFHKEKQSLKISFTLIDPNDIDKLFSFHVTLDSKTEEYKISKVDPVLKAADLLTQSLNEKKINFAMFVRKMRQEFVNSCTNS